MSNVGIFHTIVALVALAFAFWALARDGQIAMDKTAGKYYVALNIVACLSAFVIMKTGKFGPGHAIAILILALFAGTYWLSKKSKLGKFGIWGQFAMQAAMSVSVFLSLIPTTVEILSRLPVDKPLATGAEDPLVRGVLQIFMLLLVVGLAWQYRALKKSKA